MEGLCNGTCSCSSKSSVKLSEKREKKVSFFKKIDKEDAGKILIGMILFLGALFSKNTTLKLVLFILSYIILAYDVLLNAIKNFFKGKIFDENFLMTIATLGAFYIKEYPEAIGVMLFYKLGEIIEGIAVNHSKHSLKDLMDIKADYANLKLDGELKLVEAEELKLDDVIIIKAGEKFPVDGEVIKGKSSVDTSSITGEAREKYVEKGSEVLSGFINKAGLLEVKVTKVYSDSTVSKILDLVENSASKKAETEKFITRFAKVYTPIVVLLAVLLASIPPLFFNQDFSVYFYRALLFLVISCPCALLLSIPLGFFAGIGTAAKNGILIKGTNYLEALSNVKTVIFDKTGTLSLGEFKITKVKSFDMSEQELLKYAAYVEFYSKHPIAKAILKAYNSEIDKEKITDYEEIAGYGLKAKIDEREVLSGSFKLMEKEGIKYKKSNETGTIVHISIDKKYYGYIISEDELKKDSKIAIEKLKENKVKRVLMLTGDSKETALKVANELGIDKYYAELLPHQKVEKFEEEHKKKEKKETLVFIGDGINDAPVLARADIGVSLGGLGSDAAIEASDVVLMTDEPLKLNTAINIAKRTKNIVIQNIVFILFAKILIMGLGSIGFASLWTAVFADVGLAVIAILSSLRILKFRE